MNHFSLFTGDGGVDLAAEWAGYETVGMCEIDEYCRKVLDKHWPDVPKWRDVRDVTNESVRQRGIGKITVLSGGPPCQPFSIAGKRRGKADDRDLWPEMLRVIQELRPRWVLGENVANFVNMELERSLSDLEAEGYETQSFIIPACAVEAPHERKRLFLVGYSGKCGLRGKSRGGAGKESADGYLQLEERIMADTEGDPQRAGLCQGEPEGQRGRRPCDSGCKGNMADPGGAGLQRPQQEQEHERSASQCGWWTVEPDVGRGAYGLPPGLDGHRWPAGPGEQYPWEPPRIATGVKNRVARLKALGNSVVPAQVYPILKAIAEIELKEENQCT